MPILGQHSQRRGQQQGEGRDGREQGQEAPGAARQAGDAYFGTLRSKPAAAAGLTEEMIEAGCGDFEADARFSAPEKWALRYAKLMYTKPKSVDTAFYAEGKSHYSEAEIMEIGTFIAFHYGMQVFTRAIGLKVAG